MVVDQEREALRKETAPFREAMVSTFDKAYGKTE